MILIFDIELSSLSCYKLRNGNISKIKRILESEDFDTIINDIGNIKNVEAIGYVLYQGGEQIKKPVTFITPKLVSEIKKSIRFSPEYNGLMYKVINYFTKLLPKISHLLFCDTAFFVNLPKEASIYALPRQLSEKGIRRYGGYGLCHQWVWEKIQSSSGKSVSKLISVYLGNHTNIAAIREGRPVETSIGFSPVEGVLSANSCGDIDPTVVFQLYSSGISFEEINELLSQRGGFTGLLGKRCNYSDLLKKKSSECSFIRRILSYNILKYIGAFISILGGVKCIVFSGKNLEKSMGLIREISHHLDFLGGTKLSIVSLEYNRWKMINEKIKNLKL